ncbi:MAG: hypothetical protein KC561_20310, partial [Myxococcales bacterium]|nr:hypothetical protein [Myxococcales bacterium]
MGITTIVMIVGIGAMVAFYGFYYAKMKSSGVFNPAVIQDSTRTMLQRTGFQHAGMEGQPLENQVARSMQLYEQQKAQARTDSVMSRPAADTVLYWQQLYEPIAGGYSYSNNWYIPVHQQPPVPFHIVERHAKDLTQKALNKPLSGWKSDWGPQYPNLVQTGDPDLDARFQIYGHHPEHVAHVIRATPGLKEALMGLYIVDLCVLPDRIVFVDPMQRNYVQAAGGTMALMKLAMDPSRSNDIWCWLHDTVQNLLLL